MALEEMESAAGLLLGREDKCLPILYRSIPNRNRKSTVLAHIWAKERRSFRDDREEQLVKLAILLAKLLELVRRRQRSDGITGSDAGLIWIKLLEEILNAVDRILKS
jgi:hypothetical protein